jgi:hypothetical protein
VATKARAHIDGSKHAPKEKTMKLMIAAVMAMFAVAALATTEASAKGIPITAHRCKIPHYSHGIVYFTNGICR